MPRKKPFSSKQKKFQLQEKRRRKRNGNLLLFMQINTEEIRIPEQFSK